MAKKSTAATDPKPDRNHPTHRRAVDALREAVHSVEALAAAADADPQARAAAIGMTYTIDVYRGLLESEMIGGK